MRFDLGTVVLGVLVLVLLGYVAMQPHVPVHCPAPAARNDVCAADLRACQARLADALAGASTASATIASRSTLTETPPTTPSWTAAPEPPTTSATSAPAASLGVTLVSWNILEGGRERMAGIAAWLRSVAPDVVVLTECNGHTHASLAALALRGWQHPHVAFGQATSGFHVAVTSRYAWARAPLVQASPTFRHAAVTVFVALPRGGTLTVVGTHLTPAPGDERLLEANWLAAHVAALPGWLLVAGDLNSLSSRDAAHYSSSQLGHIASGDAHGHSELDAKYRVKFVHRGALDYRIVDALYAAPLVDVSATPFVASVPTLLEQTLDYMNAHHAMRLDYVLASAAAAPLARECGAVNASETARLSDHYPVLCRFA